MNIFRKILTIFGLSSRMKKCVNHVIRTALGAEDGPQKNQGISQGLADTTE